MNQNKKFMWAVALLALLLTVAVSGTLAYLTDVTDEVKNTFTPSKVTCKILEDEFDEVTKERVRIQNTGNTDAFIRAAIVVTWKNKDGQVLGDAPVKDEDYVLELNDEWFKKEHNGATFYYWPNVVAANVGETGNLIESCQLKDGVTAPYGYGLNVEILAQAIQADGEATTVYPNLGKYPVEQAWNVTYNATTKTISN